MTGYADPLYAQSLGDIGAPVALAGSGGFLLRRTIEASLADATGTYPFLLCNDWAALAGDLASLAGKLVSVVAVPDPLGGHTPDDLRAAFPDRLVPFKTHYVIDLQAPEHRYGEHHRRNVRIAHEGVEVQRLADPSSAGETWPKLYAGLIERHAIDGPAAFSQGALSRQLAVPGLSVFCARQGQRVVGMALFYAVSDDAYYHLGAYDEAGYAAKASYALFDRAIAWFRRQGFHRLLLGSGAGLSSDGTDGLSRFKRGWATGTVPGYLGGRILDKAAYRALSGNRGTDFFPAYRAPSGAPGQ
jgi:hypothetical protein